MNADEVKVATAISCEDSSHTPRRQSRAPAASMRTRTPPALEGQEPTLSDVASRDSKTHLHGIAREPTTKDSWLSPKDGIP